jgi:uncharacterized protein
MKIKAFVLCLLHVAACGGGGSGNSAGPDKAPPGGTMEAPGGTMEAPGGTMEAPGGTMEAPADPSKVMAVALDNHTEKARTLIGHLESRKYDQVLAEFDSQMAKMMDRTKLVAAWEQLVSHTGKLKRQVSATREVKGHYQMITTLCEFEKAFLNIKMTFDKDGLLAGLFFAPAEQPGVASVPPYVQADRFTEENVTFGEEPFRLPGVLCLPKDAPGSPAVVLVHGSGPNDRDETIGPNKPFRDLAHGLCSAGVAVLRYDKRTKVHAGMVLKDAKNLTLETETSEDAKRAVGFLRGHGKVKADRVFVVGHSLGAMAAPGIARDLAELAGIVLLAGNSRPLEELILEQVTFLSKLDGQVSPEEQAALDKIALAVKKVKAPDLSPDTPSEELPLGMPAPYWIHLRKYDPVAVARDLKLPILILQGGRDYQVTLAGDFARWKKELGALANVRFQAFPDLNHLFMKGDGTPGPSEYMKPGHVAAEVVAAILAFVGEPVGGAK